MTIMSRVRSRRSGGTELPALARLGLPGESLAPTPQL
jgi:hypothetical protein